MRKRWKQWWPVLKILLTLILLFFIGKRFARDLQDPQVWETSFRPGWLVLSGVCYLLGLGFSALYWQRLLVRTDQHPTTVGVLRGYYIGHLGKYIPGKAWALLMRASLVQNARVRAATAVQTAFYEVLITMTSGVVLAGVLFALAGTRGDGFEWEVFRKLFRPTDDADFKVDWTIAGLFALTLLLPLGLVTFPPVFNRLVRRLSLPFQKADPALIPQITLSAYAEGLMLTTIGWLFLGFSTWSTVQAVLPDPPAWSWEQFAQLTAAMGTAYVAGFVILIAPSGLGVREFFLRLFLVPLFGGPAAALVILVLRIVWTSAELLFAGIVYLLRDGKREAMQVESEEVKRGE